MIGESGLFAVTVMLAAGGLVAVYYRLRLEYARVIAALTVAFLAGATPLLGAVTHPRAVGEIAFFATLSVLSYVAARQAPRLQGIILIGATLLMPLVGPSTNPPPTLFASSNGFLALTPIVYIALIGTVASVRTQPWNCAAVLIALLLWPLWHVSLLPALPLLALGLAAAIDWAYRRPLVAAAPLIAGAIAWNYWLMVQYTIGTLPKDAPVSFAAMVRQQADVYTRPPFVYPFAFPGNVFFAWREGIPVSRVDALSVEPQRDVFELAFDRGADRFLLDGWGAVGSSGIGPFRTIVRSPATLAFPLRPAGANVEVSVLASLRRGHPDNASDVRVKVNGHDIGQIHVSASKPIEGRLIIPAADVGRVLRTGYNRLSIVTSGPASIAIHRMRIAPSA